MLRHDPGSVKDHPAWKALERQRKQQQKANKRNVQTEDLTVRELAEKIDTTPAYMRRILLRYCKPGPEFAEKLSKVSGAEVEQITNIRLRPYGKQVKKTAKPKK